MTADRQVHGDHAARPLLAHREPAQTRYCNPLRGLEVNEAKRQRALEAENAKLKRLLADAMLDNTAVKDLLGKMVMPVAHSPGYRSPQEYILSQPAACTL